MLCLSCLFGAILVIHTNINIISSTRNKMEQPVPCVIFMEGEERLKVQSNFRNSFGDHHHPNHHHQDHPHHNDVPMQMRQARSSLTSLLRESLWGGGPQALRVGNGRHSDLSSSFVIIIIVIYRNRGEFSDVKNEEQNRLS